MSALDSPSDLLVFIRLNGRQNKDTSDDVDPIRSDLLQQRVSRDVALERSDIVLQLNIHHLDFPSTPAVLPRGKVDCL